MTPSRICRGSSSIPEAVRLTAILHRTARTMLADETRAPSDRRPHWGRGWTGFHSKWDQFASSQYAGLRSTSAYRGASSAGVWVALAAQSGFLTKSSSTAPGVQKESVILLVNCFAGP
ncbi:uncharacterized protein F4807DRAFT_455735 [Annulohypoxylon truncatum]|uniref:uncharacterized protein n=1 Tax=Annulohypoxylon truncatum TaxID=327061 RepID=UPI002007A561|nr:uncharacterized protein F4807DRAFT_455735 [Annulohypoxylon truncatum]KAI1214094.1 hypothetical protein F4807DRAFT_455735 [Annulohypoxylon truncatum]